MQREGKGGLSVTDFWVCSFGIWLELGPSLQGRKRDGSEETEDRFGLRSVDSEVPTRLPKMGGKSLRQQNLKKRGNKSDTQA